MTRQGKITVIVVAAIHSFGSSNGSVTTNRRDAKITEKIQMEVMTVRTRLQVKISLWRMLVTAMKRSRLTAHKLKDVATTVCMATTSITVEIMLSRLQMLRTLF